MRSVLHKSLPSIRKLASHEVRKLRVELANVVALRSQPRVIDPPKELLHLLLYRRRIAGRILEKETR